VSALQDVAAERRRQVEKWGVQRHPAAWWVVILGEEFGEVCRALYEAKDFSLGEEYRQELVQVAAVAVAAIESYDAQRPPDPPHNPATDYLKRVFRAGA